jgi:predicted nucleic acid-binding protein
MSKLVYLETTIASYLAAWPSRDLRQAARQQITHEWWNKQRHQYDLCISQTVLDEAAAGDAEAVSRRMPFLANLPLLDLTLTVDEVAQGIMAAGLLPQKAARDAVHIAVASVHGVDILLTWNCRHIANATIMRELGDVVAKLGFELPILCTPEELLGD